MFHFQKQIYHDIDTIFSNYIMILIQYLAIIYIAFGNLTLDLNSIFHTIATFVKRTMLEDADLYFKHLIGREEHLDGPIAHTVYGSVTSLDLPTSLHASKH